MSKAKAGWFKGTFQDLQTRSARSFEKKNCHDCNPYKYSNLPCRKLSLKGLVFSKYRFFGGPKQVRLVHNYWYFDNVVLHLTVSLYSKKCKWRLSLNLYNIIVPYFGHFLKMAKIWHFAQKSIVFNHFGLCFQ